MIEAYCNECREVRILIHGDDPFCVECDAPLELEGARVYVMDSRGKCSGCRQPVRDCLCS